MNSKRAQNKCERAEKRLQKLRSQPPPKNMPNPVGFLFPIPPVVPASKQFVAKWQASQNGKIAAARKERDYWCGLAADLAAEEEAERLEMMQELDETDPGAGGPVNGGGGGGVGTDWANVVETGAGVAGDFVGQFSGNGVVAPPSGVQQQANRRARRRRRTQQAVAGVAILALAGGAGYVGYRYLTR